MRQRLSFGIMRRGGIGPSLALAVLVIAPCHLGAQQPDLSVEVLGGVAVPSGNTARVSGTGGAVGFGVRHRIGRAAALTTDVQLSRFYDGVSESEGFGSTTDLRVWRITVGAAFRVTNPRSAWEFDVRTGIGMAGVRSGRLPPGRSQEPQEAPDAGLNEDVFAFTTGFDLIRQFDGNYAPFFRAQFDLYDMKHFLLGLAPLHPEMPGDGPLHAFSFQAGVRFAF